MNRRTTGSHGRCTSCSTEVGAKTGDEAPGRPGAQTIVCVGTHARISRRRSEALICTPALIVVDGFFPAARFGSDRRVCAAWPFVSRRAFESGSWSVSRSVAIASSTALQCPLSCPSGKRA